MSDLEVRACVLFTGMDPQRVRAWETGEGRVRALSKHGDRSQHPSHPHVSGCPCGCSGDLLLGEKNKAFILV